MVKNIKPSLLYILQMIVSSGLALISMGFVTYHLSPDEYGQFILVQVYTTFAVGIANFGLSIGYERNFFLYEKSYTQSGQLISSAFVLVAINLSLLLLVGYLYQVEVSNFVLLPDLPENLIIIVLMAISFSSLSDYYFLFLKNSGLVKSYVTLMIVRSSIYFVISISLLLLSSLKTLSLAYALLISNILTFIFLSLTIGRKLPFIFNGSFLKDMLRISIPLTPRIFFGILSSQFDKVMLGLIGSAEFVGLYSVGQKISSLSYQFMNALGKVFQPELFRKLFSNRHKSKSLEINNYILPFLYVSIFGALIITLLAKEVITIFVAKEYFGAILVTIVLSLFHASLFFPKIFGNQLIYAEKPLILSILTLAGIAFNAALNIPFIMNWGVNGAAWATTISSIVITCITYFIAQRYVSIYWDWRKVWLIYLVFLVGVVISLIQHFELLGLNDFGYIVVKVGVVVVFVVLGFTLGIMNKSMLRQFS